MSVNLKHATVASLLALSAVWSPMLCAGISHSPASAVHKASISRPQLLKTLLPLIQRQNTQLLKDRQHIEAIAQHYLQNDDISEADFNWLKQTAADYQMEPRQRGDKTFFHDLLVRVDVVPASLVLAQALLESGLSSPTNPFGLTDKNFDSSDAAVAYYFRLLNTDKAYQPFRELRQQTRRKSQKLRGTPLAEGMGRYTPLGKRYIQKIKTTISVNQLAKLD